MKALAVLFALIASPAVAAGAILAGPAAPGPNAEANGKSVLEQVFSGGVPEPFSAVLDHLRALAGEDNVQTALIPLGRSLQRFSAHPDYFSSPRIVVAISGDRASGPNAPRLADRLFIGYQPAADVMEALSYSEETGRFEFLEIVGYGSGQFVIETAERKVCITCHQGHGPIFARPLWTESNANPLIADLMTGLGESFHGAPVRQNFDALQAFDSSSDRAARIVLAHRLWDEGCGDGPCRAALLSAALRYGLSGNRSIRTEDTGPAVAFARRTAKIWPDGLSLPESDLPNRDPVRLLASLSSDTIIETEGAINPETLRPSVLLWQPSENAFEEAAREIASLLTPGDLAWIDTLLQKAQLSGSEALELECSTVNTQRSGGQMEIRFNCAGPVGAVQGHMMTGADGPTGRIDLLQIDDAPPIHNLQLFAAEEDEEDAFQLILTQPGSGLAARLGDGRRIARLDIHPQASRAELRIVDDFSSLANALDGLAKTGDPVFRSGPFQRRLVLASVARLLEGLNG